jgi:hypothetical protein
MMKIKHANFVDAHAILNLQKLSIVEWEIGMVVMLSFVVNFYFCSNLNAWFPLFVLK